MHKPVVHTPEKTAHLGSSCVRAALARARAEPPRQGIKAEGKHDKRLGGFEASSAFLQPQKGGEPSMWRELPLARYAAIMEMKIKMTFTELCQGLPEEPCHCLSIMQEVG